MPIRVFLPDRLFDPETIEVMGRAFESAIAQRGRIDDEDKQIIAGLIMVAATAGKRDVERLARAGLRRAKSTQQTGRGRDNHSGQESSAP